ncbi:MAG TPA: DUF4397 domain-containing protein [Burkholderiaceae bacterium]|nr:DUF4397 domain-containing protein [Burkholderiaceae bacterium]
MSIRIKHVFALLAALALASCGGGGSKGNAQIRLLNLSTGYSSLDLITNIDADDNDDDKTQASSVGLETVSSYVDLDPDNYTIKLKRTGSGSVLRSFAGEQLVEDTINTYVAFGEVGAFGALRLDDTQDDADSGETKLSVANLSSAGSLDVYITDADVDLPDTTPVVSSVSSTFSSISVDSGTFRLRVTAAGDSSDVRLDVSNFTLADKGVAALIFTSTQGGTLANAIYMPQKGQPTKLTNTRSRVRAAIAVANGANASVQVAGTSVLATATAGVISSRYTLLPSGSQPVTLVVNGAAVAVPNVGLTAGADYTLLVWGTAASPQTSLVVDDNRLPSGAQSKLRLLNGMSTLAAPLTLSLDFSPVIEGTLVGQVSDPVEVTSGTDRQFDVSNTSTAANILTKTGLSLQSSSVYTFFMTDNGATPIGVLRRDR